MASSRPLATTSGGGRQAVPIPFVSRNRFEAALLPRSLGNLHNGQAGVLVTALLLFGIVFCASGRWQITAACFAIATIFKLYPIALALLLAALYPSKLSWRLALWLVGLFLLTFLLQHPPYVLAQYQAWFDRLAYDHCRLKGAYGPLPCAWLLLRLSRWP